ncbi:A/G-specific adenine glycosylase [Buchnera aphidicola]|uniref:A/G-specific adenine glycosylase n=1 Tax=Buchnera aphidicola TaxID=9 RepID=UPI0031B81DC0
MKSWQFAQHIINWQHQNGRKNLPWQNTNDPYIIWISEIMLQQTKTETVIPYFNKFIQKFKNIKTLTRSNLDTILYLWSGLGYYKRAYNIYKTAQIATKNYRSCLPNNFHHLIKLPGIGKTTAGAILSLSQNFYFSILDGNVKRVLVRFYNIDPKEKKSILTKILWKKIDQLTPVHNTRTFNQGMMDLGALICRYKNPICNLCPIKKNCKYQKNNQFHRQVIKLKKINKKIFFLILQYKEYILLVKRKKNSIWKNLFCFPEFLSQKKIDEWIKKKKNI